MDFDLNVVGNYEKALDGAKSGFSSVSSASKAAKSSVSSAVSALNSMAKAALGAGKSSKKSGEDGASAFEKLRSAVDSVVPSFIKWELATKALGKAWEAIKFGLGASEMRGDFERSLEVLYQSEKGAERTYELLSDITNRVAMSQSEILASAGAMERAGLRNGNMMVRAVEMVGKAEAARQGAGQAIQGIVERSAQSRYFSVSRDELRKVGLTYQELAKSISGQTGAGITDATQALLAGRVSMSAGIDALGAAVESKMGAIAKKKFLTVGYQAQRLKDNFGKLFDSTDSGPMAAALQKIADIFSTATETGRGLKMVLDKAFSAFAWAVENVLPYAEIAFYSVAVAGLMLYNRVLFPLGKKLASIFGVGDVKSFDSVMTAALTGLGSALDWISNNALPILSAAAVLAFPAVVALATATWSFAAGVVAATWPALALVAAFVAIYKWAGWAKEKISTIAEYFSDGEAWANLGRDVINGIINGLIPGGPLVAKALKTVASAGISAFKNAFEIKSPSRVMMRQGRHITEGVERGIEQGSPGATRAIGSAVQPPDVSKIGGGNRTSSITIAPGAIVINGVQGAEQIAADLPQILANIFEQMGLSMGAESPA